MRLYNVRLGQESFLSLSAFNVSQLVMSSVTIVTDCRTILTLAGSSPASAVRAPGYLFINTFTSNSVRASAVNVTCDLPPASSDGLDVTVDDSLQLYNALAAYASNVSADATTNGSSTLGGAAGGGNLTIWVSRNITIWPAVWKRPAPLVLTRPVTIVGPDGTFNVLDLNGVVNAVHLTPGVTVTLDNFYVVNAGALRGVLQQLVLLPVLSIPLWFFNYPRIPTAPQLIAKNCTVLLPPTEYQYFYALTVFATSVVMSDIAAQLKATTTTINFNRSTNETLVFNRLTGTGLDLFNFTLTYILRGAAFDYSLVLDNPILSQTIGSAAPNLTLVPIYDLADMMAVLAAAQAAPLQQGVVLCMLANVTIDPNLWPAAGYNISMPVLVVGSSNAGRLTWLDFQRVPSFVRSIGCAPDVYLYVQGLHLLNLPNGLARVAAGATLASSGGGGSKAAAITAAGVSDVTIYLSQFQSAAETSCPGGAPQLFLNQTTLVITYLEFRLVHWMVMQSVGTASKGSGDVVGSVTSYELSNVVLNNIYLLLVKGWGWYGYKVNLTYDCPAGVPMLYSNAYEPLEPPSPKDEGRGAGDLAGWQVALIVIGGVLAVALAASLVAWRVSVRRLRHEVEVVKSGNTDKKSSNGSADQDTASAGGRLGSSAGGGGGGGVGVNQLDPNSGRAGSAAGAKGSSNGAVGGRGGGGGLGGGLGGGGNANGGGTSDDSAAATAYDRPPLEVLNSMMAALTHEMDDQHLTILEVIGQGGFGVVYRGMWKGLNVAVKAITFQDRVAGGEKAQHRAILEAAISSSLAHPNVVTTYSYDIKPLTVQGASCSDSPDSGPAGANGQNGGGGGNGIRIIDKRPVLDWKLYLIQEYCDGGSLRTAILKRKFFDAKKGEPRMEMILDTCLELTGGLVHLHERNIIHGDLNPNNVLLKRDATKKYGAVCKIADFGLSIKMNADQSHISNMRRGTPFYTCPQILARGNMTKAADVYSMGVMMWEMYHCCMSYRSLPSGFSARENFPNFPRRAAHDFASLVVACLDAEPARRPTFAALRLELEAQLLALKRGEMRTGEEVLGPDPSGDAAHLAACQD